MKILDAEKVIALLEKVKKLLPGKSGILPHKYFSKGNMDWMIQALEAHTIDLEYDTLVCSAVKKDPLAFVDILRVQADVAEKGECKSQDLAPLLREASCVIANLILTEEEWHKAVKEEHHES